VRAEKTLRAAIAAAVAALFCAGVPAGAQTRTKTCTVSASGVDFGIYDTLSVTPLDATGTVTYSCSNALAKVTISIDRGTSGTFDRSMRSGQERLSYNLYLDVGHTQIWGDGSSGTLTFQTTASRTAVSATVYGRIFPGQKVSWGRYGDSLLVTMLF
jgi:spore coat protein U-like protein